MKLKIEITGSKVHDVGYRPWLTDVAMNASLLGLYASNRTRDNIQTVVVLVEGNEDDVRYFERTVKSEKPPRAEVDFIKSEDFTGEVMSIDKYAAMNTSSQMNKAIPLLLGMNDKMDSMNVKLDSMNDKMESMLQKQDITIQKQDIAIEKQDIAIEKQDVTISEIRELREDLIKRSDDRLARIEKDIRVIKTKIGIR